VVLVLCVLATLWWRSAAEDNRLGPPVARRYAASLRISGFTQHVQHRAQTGSAVVLLGPSTTDLQPALVTGGRMRLFPPQPATNADATEDTVLNGTVGGIDGTECDLGIGRYRPGTPVSENYRLSTDQEEQAKSGRLQVLTIEVHCGGR
jgi:hypothetical protein